MPNRHRGRRCPRIRRRMTGGRVVPGGCMCGADGARDLHGDLAGVAAAHSPVQACKVRDGARPNAAAWRHRRGGKSRHGHRACLGGGFDHQVPQAEVAVAFRLLLFLRRLLFSELSGLLLPSTPSGWPGRLCAGDAAPPLYLKSREVFQTMLQLACLRASWRVSERVIRVTSWPARTRLRGCAQLRHRPDH